MRKGKLRLSSLKSRGFSNLSILLADRILMLEKGKVIECGSHEELMAIENGKYAEMSRLALGEVDLEKPKATSKAGGSEAGDPSKHDDVFDADQETAINTPLPMSRAPSPDLSS